MDRFVTPESVRLPLSEGDFIDVKARLNHGETEELYARWAPFVVPGEVAHLSRREVRTAKVLMYLLGWSLTRDGKPVPYALTMPEADRLAVLHNLDPDSFVEIHTAIEAHETTTEEARAAQKKIRAGAPPDGVTSPSPSAAAGGSSGSAS